ncbi:hypothetical protein G6045_30105 [Streptomyces sp. YC504]|uniref:Uncharacterized protein n=1 Tax=Streptomyces mesophilus TaxID=1775132 RepID=A0A6G4XTF1_9ACTN|nr:DUF6415 family natural product biosynthesis protein [Streptomyces mesophilus]NGO79881.1 hypothetical protein [Streptomyces mesophilus]
MTTVKQHKNRTGEQGREPDPIDVAQVDADTGWALQIRLDVPPRADVDQRTLRIIGALNLLVREGLAEANPDFRAMYREAYRLLDLANGARALTDAQAYGHLRALARVARTFTVLYCRTR